MPALSDYTAGTITLTNGSVVFTGTGTGWDAADFREGDTILGIESNGGAAYVVETITDNDAGTLTQPWEGASGTYTYRMRYMADGARVTAQARELIELLGNGNLQALAGLTGPGVPVFNGPHAMVIKPETDFINGVAYDVQVDTLPDRAAYDGQAAGFAVLVSDVGDGRSAIYSKNTNTTADWSAPAYVTGPIGDSPDIAAGTTTTLAPGNPATFTVSPDGSGGYLLNAGIPAGEGFVSRGAYSGATAYVKGDVVTDNNSSWIAKIATTGNAPPVLPTTSNTQWQLLAAKGMDGTGTGNVVGPASAVADRIAVFDGTTGKLIKDGGSTIAQIVPGNNSVTNAILADMAVNTIKGRITAGTGDPQDLTAAQTRTILASELRAILGGTANAITLTSPADLASGLQVRFRATAINTGAATIAFNGGAAVACRTVTGVALPAGYIRTDVDTAAIYDGTYWVVDRQVESGTNANGGYTRFADGTQVCVSQNIPGIATNVPAASLFTGNEGEWTFPAAFSAPPALTPLLVERTSAPATGHAWARNSLLMTTTTNGLIGLLATAATFVGTVRGVANGRWF